MNYEENELEDYARYMDYIRKMIIEENADYGNIIKETEVSIGNMYTISSQNKDIDLWGFQYTIKKPLTPSSKNEWTKELKYTSQVAYEEWKRMQMVETRNKKIDDILNGLEPKHKDTLIEGLKKMDSI